MWLLKSIGTKYEMLQKQVGEAAEKRNNKIKMENALRKERIKKQIEERLE